MKHKLKEFENNDNLDDLVYREGLVCPYCGRKPKHPSRLLAFLATFGAFSIGHEIVRIFS